MNPTSLAPDIEQAEMDPGQEDVTLDTTAEKDGPGQKGGSKGGRGGFSHRGRSQGRKLDKSPTTRRPEYLAKLETKTKTDVTIAISEDTLQLNVPRRIRVSPKKSSEGKKFEDYTYAYGGAGKPQLATATALPQAYEEALTVMWQSLKNQDPCMV